jgi:hypothetical protein
MGITKLLRGEKKISKNFKKIENNTTHFDSDFPLLYMGGFGFVVWSVLILGALECSMVIRFLLQKVL